MALILDTNALSAFADGEPSLREAISRERDLALPVVVLGEYLFGIRLSRNRSHYEAWLRQNLPMFLLLNVGLQTATRYAEIRSELKAAGRPIPGNDLWIAAMAREHGWSLVSRDKHFQAVNGLGLVSW